MPKKTNFPFLQRGDSRVVADVTGLTIGRIQQHIRGHKPTNQVVLEKLRILNESRRQYVEKRLKMFETDLEQEINAMQVVRQT